MTETTTKFTDDQWAAKIEKLRIKAEHANTTDIEREILQGKVAELMQTYSISRARIDAQRLLAGNAAGEKVVQLAVNFTGTYAGGYLLMAYSAVTQLNNVKAFQRVNNRQKSDLDLVMIGFESDLEQAKLLCLSLQLQAATALDRWLRSDDRLLRVWPYLTAMQKFKEKREFVIRFGVGAGERIKLAQSKVRAEEEVKSPGTEIMLRDRGAVVQDFYDTLGLRKGRGGRRSAGSGLGAQAGLAAGRRSNTGDTGVGGNDRRRLG